MLDKLVPDGTFLTSLERSITAAGSKYSGILYANTQEVFSVAAALMVVWHLYRGHLSQRSGGLGELLLPLMEKLLLIGIVGAMYVYGPRLVDQIGQAANSLAMATGGNNAFDAVSVQMGKAIVTMWKAWSDMPVWDPADPLSASALAMKLGGVLIVLLASVAVLFVAVIVLFVMLSGTVILAFATATGPLVWAFGLLRSMEFLINGWLKLVAVGFVTKLFAAICIEFAVSAVTSSLGPSTISYADPLWKDPLNIFANLSQALAQLAIIAALVFASRSIAPMLVGGNAAIDLWGGVVNSVGMAAGAMRTVNSRGPGAKSSAGQSGTASGAGQGSTGGGGGSGNAGRGGGRGGDAGPPSSTSTAPAFTPGPNGTNGSGGHGASGKHGLQPGGRLTEKSSAMVSNASTGAPQGGNGSHGAESQSAGADTSGVGSADGRISHPSEPGQSDRDAGPPLTEAIPATAGGPVEVRASQRSSQARLNPGTRGSAQPSDSGSGPGARGGTPGAEPEGTPATLARERHIGEVSHDSMNRRAAEQPGPSPSQPETQIPRDDNSTPR